jgi:class 3 adenylate cyclase
LTEDERRLSTIMFTDLVGFTSQVRSHPRHLAMLERVGLVGRMRA